eukprot:m.176022 g.176022  ORF g.176022 m.176022 type:complete len:724 (-) comp17932_c1_seq2:44-2215(-)
MNKALHDMADAPKVVGEAPAGDEGPSPATNTTSSMAGGSDNNAKPSPSASSSPARHKRTGSGGTGSSLAGSSNPLARKLQKILQGTGVDAAHRGGVGLSDDVLEALKSLSGVFTENTKRTRQNLRGDLERRSLLINQEFISQFSEVQKRLQAVQLDIGAMGDCCREMTERLDAARAGTAGLIAQTTKLRAQQQQVQVKSEILDCFMQQYALTADEQDALAARQMTLEFFPALERVRQIHADCKQRLLRATHQTAGLAVMEHMAQLLETAYERLYRWTQTACRGLGQGDAEQPILLCRAMTALRERPVLFRYAMTELGNARRNASARAFVDALTRGGGGGTPRPIELNSHDAMRYVGDMLAWLHQNVASERELLVTVLSPPPPHMRPGGMPLPPGRQPVPRFQLSEEDAQLLQDLLGTVAEANCRALKVRVEQVLSPAGLVTSYKLANLLQFYGRTIADLISETSHLPAVINELRETCLKAFFDALQQHADQLLSRAHPPSTDLSPPEALEQTVAILQDVLSTSDSVVESVQARQEELTRILSCVLDPLLTMCQASAQRLDGTDAAAFMVNCIYRIQSTLSLYDFSDERVTGLAERLDAQACKLVAAQAQFVAARSGLDTAFLAVRQCEARNTTLAQELPSEALLRGMAQFDAYLSTADTAMIPQCDMVLGTRVRAEVREEGMKAFLLSYKRLFEQAGRVSSQEYPAQAAVLKRPPEQVLSLLQ